VEVDWATRLHTGQMVPLFAFGPHAARFSGVMDNTDIPKKIARIVGLAEFWKMPMAPKN
ncbi:MAG: alkaline phosphatase, partial [Calditrichaeota bacterium]|nr:alkaline phosphatase [Calditrichota bacterium]